MQTAELERLGSRIYSRSIHPLIRSNVYKGRIIGFDTEYDSETSELVSYQLWYKDRGIFQEAVGLKDAALLEAVVRSSIALIAPGPDDDIGRILLVSYFSLAELQHFDVAHGARDRRIYARGSMDVTFDLELDLGDPEKQDIQLRITDLARWFDKMPLSAVAKAFGLEKKEYDTRHVTKALLSDPIFREYGLHDAYLASEIFTRLRDQFMQLGVDIVDARTGPSASSRVFRLHFIKEKYYCDDNSARKFACLGTWGGRAEVFDRGKLVGRHYEWDLKGAYPTAALQIEEFPIQESWHHCHTLSCLMADRGGFGVFNFEFPADTRYPSLPVYSRQYATMLYPLAGKTYCTSYEIKFALEQGASITMIQGVGYKNGTDCLARYMRQCVESRAKAEGAAKIMWKLLANALIGKFAQRVDSMDLNVLYQLAEQIGVPIEEIMEMANAERAALCIQNGFKAETISLGPIWMPEWNGLITGLTRSKTSRAIVKSQAVYAHTDSVWSPDPNPGLGDEWELKMAGDATVARTRLASLVSDTGCKVCKGERRDMGEMSPGESSSKTCRNCLNTGVEIHLAHHSIHDRSAAFRMLNKFDGTIDVKEKYEISRVIKFKEALRSGRRVGTWQRAGEAGTTREGTTEWDGKRQIADGSTLPWPSVGEYETWRETNWR